MHLLDPSSILYPRPAKRAPCQATMMGHTGRQPRRHPRDGAPLRAVPPMPRTSRRCRPLASDRGSERPIAGGSVRPRPPARPFAALALTLALLVPIGLQAASPAASTAGKELALERSVKRLERYLYDQEASGALAERLARIERDLLGHESTQSVVEKISQLNTFLFAGRDGVPSLDMKVNYIEWRVFKATHRGALDTRLTDLEKLVVGGRPSSEPYAFRVEQLVQLVVDDGIIDLRQVELPAGTSLELSLLAPISSARARVDDRIPLRVTRDLVLDGVLLVAQGGEIDGRVASVRRGGRFGRSGRIGIQLDSIAAVDGSTVHLTLETIAGRKVSRQHLGLAVGTSAVGYLALGPVGLAGGMFIKGRDIELPADTPLTATTREPYKLFGIAVGRKADRK